MRALVLNSVGDAPVLSEAERAAREPDHGHVIVRVSAAGFCHHDALIMAGVLRRGVRLPLILGHEACGTVERLGQGVAEDWLGARVTLVPGSLGHVVDGCFAELVRVPVASLVRVTSGISDEAAAALACPAGVAIKAVEQVGGVRPDDVVAVTGVSGGLGAMAAQVAHAAGAMVIGVTSSTAKVSRLEEQPWLDAVVVEDGVPVQEMVRALTDDEGADLFVDTVGTDVGGAVSSVAPGGRVVLLGQIAGTPSKLSPAEVVFREARVLGSLGADRVHVERAMTMVGAGVLTPIVDRVLPMTAGSLETAYRLVRERALFGRIVLKP